MTILLCHLEFSRKEKMYISIGKTNIGIIQTLKSLQELINALIKRIYFLYFSSSKIILLEQKVLNILYSIRAKSIIKYLLVDNVYKILFF